MNKTTNKKQKKGEGLNWSGAQETEPKKKNKKKIPKKTTEGLHCCGHNPKLSKNQKTKEKK